MDNYMNFPEQPKAPIVKTSDWFLTMLISSIPLIGFIMLVVWAIDKEGNPNKSNWAKATLIWYAIGFAFVMLVLFFIGFGAITGVFDDVPAWD